MSDDPNLPEALESLYRQLRELNARLRDHRWKKFRRVDPFVEAIFDRKEKAQYLFGEDVTIHDSVVMNGDIKIGDGTHVGQFCNLDGSGGLTIGGRCAISAGVRIMTHDAARWAVSGGAAKIERSSVSIGDRCFIGANAVITRGVTLGEQCVVGAGAVVTRSYPQRSILLGMPARLVGTVVVEGERIEFQLKVSE